MKPETCRECVMSMQTGGRHFKRQLQCTNIAYVSEVGLEMKEWQLAHGRGAINMWQVFFLRAGTGNKRSWGCVM
jgi:hypothetical protein